MLRPLLILSLSSVPFLVALMPVQTPVCPNTIVHEPVLLFDHSGYGVGGHIDRALTVYGDGTLRLSSSFASINSKSEVAFASEADVQQLLLDLAQLGAGSLCDNFVAVADLPPSTLTILRNTTDSKAHTFSWFVGIGAYGPVEQRIQTFIQTWFPNS